MLGTGSRQETEGAAPVHDDQYPGPGPVSDRGATGGSRHAVRPRAVGRSEQPVRFCVDPYDAVVLKGEVEVGLVSSGLRYNGVPVHTSSSKRSLACHPCSGTPSSSRRTTVSELTWQHRILRVCSQALGSNSFADRGGRASAVVWPVRARGYGESLLHVWHPRPLNPARPCGCPLIRGRVRRGVRRRFGGAFSGAKRRSRG